MRVVTLACLVWGALYLTEHPNTEPIVVSERVSTWPPVDQWRSLSLTRVGWPQAHLIQTHEGWRVRLSPQSPSDTHSKRGASDAQERALDPLLAERLSSLEALVTLEEREIDTEDARRALGLTRVALTVTLNWSVTSPPKQGAGSPFQQLHFRVGAEHLRHSTWVAPVDEQGRLLGGALRVRGRLRRVLDHDPHRWADRRVSVIEPAQIREIRCARGSHQSTTSSDPSITSAPLSALRRAWVITRAPSGWRVKREGPSPLIDQAATDTLNYTLTTLRFDRFLGRDALPKGWRPTHTYSWRAADGTSAWLSVGRALVGTAQSYSWVGISASGAGVIPQHLGNLLSPQLTTLLKRAPLPTSSAALSRVSYLAPPAPLALPPSPASALTSSTSWMVEKRATGWWLISPREAPLSPEATQHLLSALTRDSAAASLGRVSRPQTRSKSSEASAELAGGAELHLSLIDEGVCAALNTRPPCQLTLTQQKGERVGAVMSWRRVEDGVSLSLSQAHHSALTRLPTP